MQVFGVNLLMRKQLLNHLRYVLGIRVGSINIVGNVAVQVINLTDDYLTWYERCKPNERRCQELKNENLRTK